MFDFNVLVRAIIWAGVISGFVARNGETAARAHVLESAETVVDAVLEKVHKPAEPDLIKSIISDSD
jgi:hypothetical protein